MQFEIVSFDGHTKKFCCDRICTAEIIYVLFNAKGINLLISFSSKHISEATQIWVIAQNVSHSLSSGIKTLEILIFELQIGPSGERALPSAAGINVVGH